MGRVGKCAWRNVLSRWGDYRQVLESLVRIKDPEADVPLPAGGRWLPAGEIMGDGYSLAWRILDAAQGWGVAQRRKRIFAVLDLDGQRAGEVLFESEGVSGYTPTSIKARQGTAGGAAQGAGETGICLNGLTEGAAIEFNPTDSRIRIRGDDICQTLCSRMGTGGNCVPLVFGISSDQSNAMLSDNPHSGVYEAQICRTLDCNGGSAACNQGGMVVVEPTYALTTGEYTVLGREQTPPLMARDYKDPMIVNCHAEEVPYLVRRLTPLECCRLQGFPDGWTENLETEEPGEQEIARWVGMFEDWYRAQGKATRASPGRVTKWLKDPHNDAAQYKAYGNSVAVPCVFFVLAGIVWAEERGDET